MRKTTAALILLFVATAATVGSCSRSEQNSKDEMLFSYIEAESSFRLEKSAADYGEEHDLSFGCKADLIMPQVLRGHDAAALRDSILSITFGSNSGNPDTIITNHMRRVAESLGYALSDTVIPDSVIAASPNFLSRYDGCYSASGNVEMMTGRILSYAITTSGYIPHAAHGMYEVSYLNYDIDSARIITLEKIFTPEGIDALPAVIRDAAVEMTPTIGRTDITELPSRGNFYISADNDIVFAYQPYEVASYAQGEIQIPLPAYVLSNYLTEYGTQLLLQ